MTDPRAELREKVARAIYNRARDWFRADPATLSIGGDWKVFADEVFPPWDEVDDKTRHLEDADAAISVVLEESAKVAEDYEGEGMDKDQHTQSGDAYVTRRDIAAAIRALIPTAPNEST